MKNKSDYLFENILSLIRSGTLKPGDKFPSEYELAEKFGVNKTTANKAVSRLVECKYLIRTRGRGGTVVSDAVLHRIKGVIGYKLSLLSGRMFSSRLLFGAQMAASANGYALQYIENDTKNEDQRATHWQKRLLTPLSGILLTCSTPPPPDCAIPCFNVDVVQGDHLYSDDLTGGKTVARLLASRGHCKVVVISNLPLDTPRVRGFCEEFETSGNGGQVPKISILSDRSIFNPLAVWQEIKRITPDVTGIFCSSDEIAMRLMIQLKEIGVECPRDISICGYGNMPLINLFREVTSVDQFPEDMGYAACSKLIELIENKISVPRPVEICTPVKLVNPNATVGYVP